jgi:hypothetical protein
MTIKKDENVIAGRAGPTITPVETDISITNAKTGQTYADEKEAKADVDNPATATTSEDIQRDVAIKVNKLDIFGEVMLRDVGSRLRKAAADVSGYAAPIIGALYGPAAGAAAGAFLGQYKRENPGDPNQALQMALRGGISGLGTNIATGQGFGLGGGLKGAYGLNTFNPLEIGKAVLNMPAGADVTRTGTGLDAFLNPDATGLNRFKAFTGAEGPGANVTEVVSTGGKDFPASIKELARASTKDIELSTLDKILKNAGILKTAATFASIYGTYALGNAIKQEQEQQKKDMAKFQGPFGERGTDEQLLALLATPELISAPDTALAAAPVYSAEGGGVMDLRQGGESEGPGTGTSDDIPAMLSDGEFVMTAKAVRGAGGGDRREGAKKMYQMMDQLEARA